jgi:alpha-L-rhamnosidase
VVALPSTTLAGIEPAAPGYREIRVRPRPGGGLTWARASHQSPYGPVAVEWRAGERFELDLDIPPGTSAEVWVPARSPESVTESGGPAGQAEGVSAVRVEDGCAVFRVGAGRYRFASGG